MHGTDAAPRGETTTHRENSFLARFEFDTARGAGHKSAAAARSGGAVSQKGCLRWSSFE